jgi:hypothetical protein
MPLAVSPYARASRRRTWRFLPPGRGGPGDFKREQGFWWKRQARRIKRQRFEAISKSNERCECPRTNEKGSTDGAQSVFAAAWGFSLASKFPAVYG